MREESNHFEILKRASTFLSTLGVEHPVVGSVPYPPAPPALDPLARGRRPGQLIRSRNLERPSFFLRADKLPASAEIQLPDQQERTNERHLKQGTGGGEKLRRVKVLYQ